MRESDLHNHLYTLTSGMPARWPHVLTGPGDDCAVVAPQRGSLLVTVDQLVEGRHFDTGTPVNLIARKAIARSVSDIAAMGGDANAEAGGWALATGILPTGYPHARELTDALHHWAAHWGFPIVGGDIASGEEGGPLSLTVTIAGRPHPIRGPVLRSGARPGDEVWVTGRIGNSLASGRHLAFEPRLTTGAWLCQSLGERLHAMIDVSDGLGRDAARVARASGSRIELDGPLVPLHADVTHLHTAVGDGEDYELCLCVSPGAGLPARAPDGVELTRIGRVVAGSGCSIVIDGVARDASELGWDHQ